MKTALVGCMLFLFSGIFQLATAQNKHVISLKTGVSFSTYLIDWGTDDILPYKYLEPLNGLPVFVQYDLFFSSGLKVGASFAYLQKGAEDVYPRLNNFNQEVIKRKVYRNHYISLSVPVGYVYDLMEHWSFHTTIAPRVDFYVDWEPKNPSVFPPKGSVFGLNGGFSLAYEHDHMTYSLEAMYQHDISPFSKYDSDYLTRDVLKQTTITVKHQFFALLLGLGYRL